MAFYAQNSFTGGEISPRLQGRLDLPQYRNSVAHLENFIIHPHGGISNRPGTMFGWEVKDPTKKTRLIPYENSTEQSYVLEVGAGGYIRFGKNGSLIYDGLSPVEVTTNVPAYTEAELAEISYCQNANVLWLVHPNYKPRRVYRVSDTSWTVEAGEAFIDGPYLPVNASATTLTPSGASGSVTVTASATTGINGGAGFQTTDVGRLLRIFNGTAWAWGQITARTSTTVVTVSVVSTTNFPTSAKTEWRLGKWSDTDGWPACVTFFEGRICYAGAPGSPMDIDLSETDNYLSFKVDSPVVASNACAFTLVADRLNAVRWMVAARGLDVGTNSAEWVLSGGNSPVSPTTVNVQRYTSIGSALIRPMLAGNVALFVARGGRALHEYAYRIDEDGYRAPDVTRLAEHMLRDNAITDADYGPSDGLAYCVRDDGELMVLTYLREEEVIGWSRFSTPGGLFEGVACVPEGGRDVPYFLVKRGANRYVEYLPARYSSGAFAGAHFVDCGVAYSGAATSTITGLDHLEGEAVTGLADGYVFSPRVVSGGEITLDRNATVVNVGLAYNCDMQTLPLEAPQADGASTGRRKVVSGVSFKFSDSYGGAAGPDSSSLDEFIWNEGLVYGAAPAAFTGDKSLRIEGGQRTEKRVYFRQSRPLPVTINALVVDLEVTER